MTLRNDRYRVDVICLWRKRNKIVICSRRWFHRSSFTTPETFFSFQSILYPNSATRYRPTNLFQKLFVVQLCIRNTMSRRNQETTSDQRPPQVRLRRPWHSFPRGSFIQRLPLTFTQFAVLWTTIAAREPFFHCSLDSSFVLTSRAMFVETPAKKNKHSPPTVSEKSPRSFVTANTSRPWDRKKKLFIIYDHFGGEIFFVSAH